MKSLAREFESRVRFVLVEADEPGKLLERFDAGSFPSYLLFEDGEEVDRLTLNFAPWFLEDRLRSMLDHALDRRNE